MPQTIIVLDFGSQYTQVIARDSEERYIPFYLDDTTPSEISNFKPIGIVLSGDPQVF